MHENRKQKQKTQWDAVALALVGGGSPNNNLGEALSSSSSTFVDPLETLISSGGGAVGAAIGAFSKTPEGLQYLEKNNLGGYRKLRGGELEAMSPYAVEVRKILGLK